MPRVRRIIGFLVLFLAVIGAVIAIQHGQLMKIKRYRPFRDSLYMPSAKYVKLVTLGYDMIFADFLWLRAIQAFGGHFMSDRDYRPVYHFFDVITDLDPNFIEAYTFGNTVISDEGGEIERGLELLDKGIIKTLNKTYKLGYWGGYICVWQVFKPLLAKYYFRMALKCDDCPDFVKRLLYQVDLKMGRYRIAFERFVELLLEALDRNDAILEDIGWRKVKEVVNQWNISILLGVAREYKKKHGRDIANLQDLLASEILKQYEAPTLANLQNTIEQYQHKGKSLLFHFQEIVKQSIVPQQGLPRGPENKNYVIWVGKTSEDNHFIMDEDSLKDELASFLARLRMVIEKYNQEHGSYPTQLGELLTDWEEFPEFFGGQWLYNPETGEIRSSTYPNL